MKTFPLDYEVESGNCVVRMALNFDRKTSSEQHFRFSVFEDGKEVSNRPEDLGKDLIYTIIVKALEVSSEYTGTKKEQWRARISTGLIVTKK